jgi:hypothetical protein
MIYNQAISESASEKNLRKASRRFFSFDAYLFLTLIKLITTFFGGGTSTGPFDFSIPWRSKTTDGAYHKVLKDVLDLSMETQNN